MMQLTLKKVSRTPNGFMYYISRNYGVGITCIYVTTLRSGSKYYCQFFTDGTATCGMYDVKGKWHKVPPNTINDYITLPPERKLFSRFVIVNGDYICITYDKMAELKEVFKFDSICKALDRSGKMEWYR